MSLIKQDIAEFIKLYRLAVRLSPDLSRETRLTLSLKAASCTVRVLFAKCWNKSLRSTTRQSRSISITLRQFRICDTYPLFFNFYLILIFLGPELQLDKRFRSGESRQDSSGIGTGIRISAQGAAPESRDLIQVGSAESFWGLAPNSRYHAQLSNSDPRQWISFATQCSEAYGSLTVEAGEKSIGSRAKRSMAMSTGNAKTRSNSIPTWIDWVLAAWFTGLGLIPARFTTKASRCSHPFPRRCTH